MSTSIWMESFSSPPASEAASAVRVELLLVNEEKEGGDSVELAASAASASFDGVEGAFSSLPVDTRRGPSAAMALELPLALL